MSNPQPPGAPAFHIHRFWTEYKPDPNNEGALRAIDMVAYGPIAQRDRSVTVERVSRLMLVNTKGDANINPAIAMARGRWEFIKPRYDAWKAGQTVPETGTPLAAWNGASREQIEVLQQHGVTTIEELSALTDVHIQRIQVPGLRAMIETAKRYLVAADTHRFTKELTVRDETIANQKAEIDDLRQKLDELAGIVAMQGQGAAPRGRGRGRSAKAGAAA